MNKEHTTQTSKMKLNEIVTVPHQPNAGFDVSDFDLSSEQLIGTAENIPIIKLNGGPKDPSLVLYGLKQNDKIVSMVVGVWGTLNGQAFFIKRTYTIPTMRNRGLITALYSALYSKYKIRLVSDTKQSPETISIWKKLSNTFQVKVFNADSKQLYDLQDVSLEDIYKDEKCYLVLESTVVLEGEWWHIPDTTHSKMLKDYLIYTHPDNEGKYE